MNKDSKGEEQKVQWWKQNGDTDLYFPCFFSKIGDRWLQW